jgi:hypothetical protein
MHPLPAIEHHRTETNTVSTDSGAASGGRNTRAPESKPGLSERMDDETSGGHATAPLCELLQ